MKKIILLGVFLLFCTAYVQADYGSDISKANALYKEGNYSEALQYYIAAYKQKPSQQLKTFIWKVNALIKKTGGNEMPKSDDGYEGWSRQQNFIYSNPLTLLGSQFMLGYERGLTPNFSVGLSGAYGWGGFGFSGSGMEITTYSAGVKLNWYPQSRGLNAWYLGPDATYYSYNATWTFKNYDQSETVEKLSFNYPVIGVHGGYRWVFDSGFAMDLWLGVGNMFGSIQDFGGMSITFSGPMPSFGFDLGFAF
jgi:hypothetical protein